MIKFYHLSVKENNFLKNNDRLENFLSDISITINDVIEENYYEEYRENFSQSSYPIFNDIKIDPKYLVSEELLNKMIVDYNNKNPQSTDDAVFTDKSGKVTPYNEWSNNLKKVWLRNTKNGFSWAMDSKHVSLFEYNDLHTNQLYKNNKVPSMFNPTNSRTSFYQEMDTMVEILQKEYPNNIIKKSGGFWYKPDYYMGWHNNNTKKGARLYLTYSDENGKSFFRYRDNNTGNVITTYDQKGWTIRMFDVSERPNDFYWHSVYSKCNRFSFGFNIEEDSE
jgi:hypothetical protein